MTRTTSNTRIDSIVHPLIGGMYLKSNLGKGDDRVLVLETRFPVSADEGEDFKTCLSSLLSDLPTLERQAKAKVGPFDRVDIRYTH